MARKTRTPNTQLNALLAQAGWTRVQLARHVNRLGEQLGVRLSYSGPSVSQWIAGTPPKPQVTPLIIEALSMKLGRPVTHDEAGFARPVDETTAEQVDTVEELIDLARQDMDPTRRGLLAATAVFSAALAVPSFADVAHADPPSPGKATTRIGQSQVASVRRMTERIADILDEDGAGHARPMAGAYLVNTVGPWLRANATEQVARDMRAAASDLVYLVGWMAMYENDHAQAQHRYVRALRLAGEAGDHVTYCRVLRGMSLQYTSLGHGVKGLQLADSAAEAAPASGPRLVAFLRGQQAAAAAMTGAHHQAHARIREAETALGKADNRRDAIGGYDRTAWLFHLSKVLYEERDLPGSIKAMQDSIRIQPAHERQGRVHAYATLATRQLEYGHLDAACGSWSRFLDDYEHVSSARGDEHLATMRRDLRPYATARPVRELADRAREVAAMKAA